jgi:methylmalonyl-CoA mutase C-terminal domain/subunit
MPGTPNRRHRILIAKPGLDGHDRGAKIVVKALTDAGYEIIYTGLHQEPEAIAEAALQEDVEAVGLSVLSGAHMTLFPAVLKLLKKNGMSAVLLFGGGIVPAQDVKELRKCGVGEIFTPGTDTRTIVEYLDKHFSKASKPKKRAKR